MDIATLANDTVDMVIDSLMEHMAEHKSFYSLLKNMDREEKYGIFCEVLNPKSANMVVTPKEIDEIITKVSKIIADGINMALHEGIGAEDIHRYVN